MERTTPEPQTRWRFSLRALMMATAAIATLIWLFLLGWALDEVVVLAAWGLALVIGTAYGRARRRSSLVLTIVLGGVLPAASFWLYHFLLGIVWHMVMGDVEQCMLTVLAAIMAGGATAALLVAGALAPLSAKQRGFRSRLLAVTSIICIVAIGVVVRLRWPPNLTSWTPILILPVLHSFENNPIPPAVALTPDGGLLAIACPLARHLVAGPQEVRIWNIRTGKEIAASGIKAPLAQCLCFSPDGQQIAVVEPDGLFVFEVATGRLIKSLAVPTSNPWITRTCCFSPDGSTFALSSYDQKYKVFVWETAGWSKLHEHHLKDLAQPEACGNRLLLLTFTPGAARNVALLDAETLAPLFPPRAPYSPVYRPVVSRDGSHVCAGKVLLNLESGSNNELPAVGYCFARQGRCIATRRCDIHGNQFPYLPDWRFATPILRQLWQKHYYAGQVVLIDVVTGHEIASSPNYKGEALLELNASADGSTVVGTSWHGNFVRVWRVPD